MFDTSTKTINNKFKVYKFISALNNIMKLKCTNAIDCLFEPLKYLYVYKTNEGL